MLFKKEDPKTLLEGIKKAQKLLDERYEKGQVSPEIYQKQSSEFAKRREKYLKKLGKSIYDVE